MFKQTDIVHLVIFVLNSFSNSERNYVAYEMEQ